VVTFPDKNDSIETAGQQLDATGSKDEDHADSIPIFNNCANIRMFPIFWILEQQF
jgi:hypothetical protein